MSKFKEKQTIKLDSVKPQNIAVLALQNVKGGVHIKTNKAKRLKAKQNFKREMRANDYVGSSFMQAVA